MTLAADIETAIPALHASAPVPLPFAPSLHIRSFLLRRDEGNVLIYSTPEVRPGAFADVGGIARAYLNHRHEAAFGADLPGVPLFVHEADRAAVARRRKVRAAFSRRHQLDGNLEVIPTPGHTPGATAYLWDNGQHRFLFTGDTIYLRDGEWVAAMLASSDRTSYLDSLELIRELAFDVLVPWAAARAIRTTRSPAMARPAGGSTRSSTASAAVATTDAVGDSYERGWLVVRSSSVPSRPKFAVMRKVGASSTEPATAVETSRVPGSGSRPSRIRRLPSQVTASRDELAAPGHRSGSGTAPCTLGAAIARGLARPPAPHGAGPRPARDAPREVSTGG